MSVSRMFCAVAAVATLSFGATAAVAQPADPAALQLQLLQAMQAMQAAGGQPAAQAEPECNASAIASWRPDSQLPVDWNLKPALVDSALIHTVTSDVAGASDKLASASVAPVTLAEASRLTGVSEAQLRPAKAGLSPYLVRAVYPVPKPKVSMSWFGDVLEVDSEGAGCAPFRNTPVLVFLEKAPARVFVAVTMLDPHGGN